MDEGAVYTDDFKELFAELDIKIISLPANQPYLKLEEPLKHLDFTSPELFEEFLTLEETFWKRFTGVNSTPIQSCKRCIDDAKKNLQTARAIMENTAEAQKYTTRSNAENNLQRIKVTLDNDLIYSKSRLATELAQYENKTNDFFIGFFHGLGGSNSGMGFNREAIFGICKAFEYLGEMQRIDDLSPGILQSFDDAHVYVVNKANEYVRNYDVFIEQKQTSYNELCERVQENIDASDSVYGEMIAEHNSKLTGLEKLYGEKLKLAKPAEYWKEMHNHYNRQGQKWLGISIVIAFAVIGVVAALIFLGGMSDVESWVNIVKNTAILTVAVAAAMLLLRITLKMVMSSYHLSRDAKEREQLSYFYLALMNDKGVTENERALVLSSLFSRSDTGLLKGDSSPEMPSMPATTLLGNKD